MGRNARLAVVWAAAWVVLASPAALARSMVHFTNRSFETGKTLDVPFFDNQLRRLEGSNYVAQLYAGYEAATLSAVGKPVPFSTNGYFFGGAVDVHARFDGGSTWVQVRAWEAAGGPTFEEAAMAGRWTGVSDPLFLPWTGDGSGIPVVPAYMIGLRYPGRPLIVRQPESMVVRAGERATLSVVASGVFGLGYHWYQGPSGDLTLSRRIEDATEAKYITPPLTTNSMFWVFVSGLGGYVDSATATVWVLPAEGLRLEIASVAGLPALTIAGALGATHRLEYREDLGVGEWRPVVDLVLPTNSFSILDWTATNWPMRFYRVVIP